jgi:hypothetical protein
VSGYTTSQVTQTELPSQLVDVDYSIIILIDLPNTAFGLYWWMVFRVAISVTTAIF